MSRSIFFLSFLSLVLFSFSALAGETLAKDGKKSCNSGDCTFTCQGADCDFSCNGGDCNYICEAGADCDMSCNGGNCKVACNGAKSCDLNCNGEDCEMACVATKRCEVVGEESTLTCDGSSKTCLNNGKSGVVVNTKDGSTKVNGGDAEVETKGNKTKVKKGDSTITTGKDGVDVKKGDTKIKTGKDGDVEVGDTIKVNKEGAEFGGVKVSY